MNQSFIDNVTRTENQDFDGFRERLSSEKMLRLLHGAIGLSTESGELLDAIKKHIFYGSPLDEINIEEEIGDALFYIAIVIDALGIDPPSPETKVINKLKIRYPERFNKDNAENRKLERERESLESALKKTPYLF